jgi:3-hydroxypropanoate dehydrogenase
MGDPRVVGQHARSSRVAKLRYDAAFLNSPLQGACLTLAARASGLDCVPCLAQQRQVDAEFLAGTSWRSNFLCVLGHGDPVGVFPFGPRLDFDEVCRIA